MHIPMWLIILSSVIGLLLAACALHLVLRWMDRRQWIFYSRPFRRRSGRTASSDSRESRGGGGGGMAGVLTSFQQLVEPEVRYVIDEKEQRNAARGDEASPADR